MKRFRFRLQRLLDLRAHREREVLLRLAEAAGHCARVGRRLREVEGQRQAAFGSPFSPGGAVDLTLFAYRERYLAWLEAQRRRLAAELAEREKTHREVQVKYLEVSKERKVLEKLKERRAAEYYREARQEEFAAQDEIAASRFGRRQL